VTAVSKQSPKSVQLQGRHTAVAVGMVADGIMTEACEDRLAWAATTALMALAAALDDAAATALLALRAALELAAATALLALAFNDSVAALAEATADEADAETDARADEAEADAAPEAAATSAEDCEDRAVSWPWKLAETDARADEALLVRDTLTDDARGPNAVVVVAVVWAGSLFGGAGAGAAAGAAAAGSFGSAFPACRFCEIFLRLRVGEP
jgi:hypothetical protein